MWIRSLHAALYLDKIIDTIPSQLSQASLVLIGKPVII